MPQVSWLIIRQFMQGQSPRTRFDEETPAGITRYGEPGPVSALHRWHHYRARQIRSSHAPPAWGGARGAESRQAVSFGPRTSEGCSSDGSCTQCRHRKPQLARGSEATARSPLISQHKKAKARLHISEASGLQHWKA